MSTTISIAPRRPPNGGASLIGFWPPPDQPTRLKQNLIDKKVHIRREGPSRYLSSVKNLSSLSLENNHEHVEQNGVGGRGRRGAGCRGVGRHFHRAEFHGQPVSDRYQPVCPGHQRGRWRGLLRGASQRGLQHLSQERWRAGEFQNAGQFLERRGRAAGGHKGIRSASAL